MNQMVFRSKFITGKNGAMEEWSNGTPEQPSQHSSTPILRSRICVYSCPFVVESILGWQRQLSRRRQVRVIRAVLDFVVEQVDENRKQQKINEREQDQ